MGDGDASSTVEQAKRTDVLVEAQMHETLIEHDLLKSTERYGKTEYEFTDKGRLALELVFTANELERRFPSKKFSSGEFDLKDQELRLALNKVLELGIDPGSSWKNKQFPKRSVGSSREGIAS